MKIAIAAGVALALAASTAAFADPVQVRTSTAGLDVHSDGGARAMLRRLDNATLSACGVSKFSLSEVKRSTRATECYKDAMGGAVQSLAAPKVTALYRGDIQTLAAR